MKLHECIYSELNDKKKCSTYKNLPAFSHTKYIINEVIRGQG